jgi:anti-repressor protein
MNDLIPVTVNDSGEQVISGRALHEFLGVQTPYADWIRRKIEYGFSENEDYILVTQICATNNPKNPETERTDHALKLDMAKEICMLEKNEKGKQARQYFLQIEKDWNSPEKIMARALIIAERKMNRLTLEVKTQRKLISDLQPKAEYLDKILQNAGTININAIAKDYGMSGVKLNRLLHGLGVQYLQDKQWLLYAKYQDCGYVQSETIAYDHRDGTPDTRLHTRWTQKGRLFLYDLLKANGIVPVTLRGGQQSA